LSGERHATIVAGRHVAAWGHASRPAHDIRQGSNGRFPAVAAKSTPDACLFDSRAGVPVLCKNGRGVVDLTVRGLQPQDRIVDIDTRGRMVAERGGHALLCR
jgi:hypothetical protein